MLSEHILNAKNLQVLIEKCSTNQNYYALIVLKDARQVIRFVSEMINIHKRQGIDGIRDIRYLDDDSYKFLDEYMYAVINFDSGSYIKITTQSDDIRSDLFYDGLIDYSISNSLVHERFERHRRLYIHQNFQTSAHYAQVEKTLASIRKDVCKDEEIFINEDDNDQINSFLNSFMVK